MTFAQFNGPCPVCHAEHVPLKPANAEDSAMYQQIADNFDRDIQEDRKDAERYRWLRSSSTGPSQIWELLSDDCQPPILTLKCMGDLDAAIDKAMQEDKP